MTTFAVQPDTALTRSARAAYRDDVRDLGGPAYDDVEAAAWDQLQATLRELEAERAALAAAPPAD